MSSAFVFDFVLCGQFLSERGCSRCLNPWSLLSHALSTMKPWRPQCICVICQMFLKFVISLNQGEKKRRFYARMKNVQTWRQVVGFSPATPAHLKREFFPCVFQSESIAVVFRLSTNPFSIEALEHCGCRSASSGRQPGKPGSINQLIHWTFDLLAFC